jgi:site-specific DNA-methyltransferase (adenine-specific)
VTDGGVPLERWNATGGSSLLRGDNLACLGALRESHCGAVTLAYLDPPFLTNRVHEAKDRPSGVYRPAFDDRWADRAAYLESLAPRLMAVRELLAPHGSVVIHVDPKTSHYVKVLADEVFGDEAFASEIVWRYRRWPSKTPNFQRVHDVLLRYRRDPRVPPRWNPLYEPLAASTLATWGTTKQRAVFEKSGRRARSSRTEEPTAGVPMGDVWDIGVIAPVARERTGYPSQKPEALLDRLILALSDPGDLVLDPYAGSGTTLAVAARHGRRFLGIDESEVAVETILARMAAAGIPLARDGPAPVHGVACAAPAGKLTVAVGVEGPSRPGVRRATPRPTPSPMRLSRVR